jgi:hypothetical protein
VEGLSTTYSDAGAAPTYAELLARKRDVPPSGYRLGSQERAEQAAAVMAAVQELAAAQPPARPFDHDPPRPRPELRFIPRD